MSALRKSLKYISKIEWLVLFIAIAISVCMRAFKLAPVLICDVVSLSIGSGIAIHETFYSEAKRKIPIKNRLIGAIVRMSHLAIFLERAREIKAPHIPQIRQKIIKDCKSNPCVVR